MTSYAYLGRDYDYYDAFDLINESNHYSEIFNEFIDDVVENIEQYIDKEKDTGWYYNMRDYNVNKNGDGVKLKVIIKEFANSKMNGYINPDRFPEITIFLNKTLLSNILKFKSVLLHELTHVIKVYIKNRNGMDTVKETLSSEIYLYEAEFDIHYKNKIIENRIHNLLEDIFYILTSNEQLATINETCKYLSSMSVSDVHNILQSYIEKGIKNDLLKFETNATMVTRYALIYNILNYLHENHFLNIMLTISEKFNNLNISIRLLIAYYLNKHGYIKPKLHYITYDTVYSSIYSEKYVASKNIEDELYHVYECIYNNFEKYKRKLCDAIYVIMEKNNMFLPIDEVYKIIPYRFKSLLEQNIIEY